MGDFDDPLLEDFCNEGRIVETDHGSFILINVYAPNAGENEQGRPRLSFKLSFLKALKQKLDELVQIGRNIVVVGDLNVAHKDKDVYRKWNIRDIYTAEEINFMDALLTEYVDLFRYFHPNEEDAFSVWDQKKEARIHNEGLRIDYALCDQGFLSQVASTDIIKMVPKVWSDHAAVVTTLIEQPVLPPHPKPAISSSNMRKFIEETKQKRLTSLFSQSPLKSAKHRETMNEKDGQEPSDTATKESEGEFMTSKKRQQVDESENPFQAPVSKAKKHTSSSTIAGPALVKDRQRSLLSYLQKG
ncbi:hypothetical protein KP509_08G065600 [Ceratopteris richardii]|nr:hypothetical protein KP509_08G065600 [Ceratopteris richardii]